MSSVSHSRTEQFWPALTMVLLMLLTSLSQMNIHSLQPAEIIDRSSENPWSPDEQPWSQYGGVPTRNGSMPNHSADGGPGIGSVEDITSLASINDPVINWVGLDDGIGSDAYGSIIGNFSANLNTCLLYTSPSPRD